MKDGCHIELFSAKDYDNYAVGVASKSPKLKVGSIVSRDKLAGTMQNHTKSSSCLCRAITNAGSGKDGSHV